MTPLTKSNKKEHSHSCNFCVLGTKFEIDVIYCTYKNGRRSSQGGQQRELRLEKHYYHQVWENIIFPFKSSVAWGTPSNPKSPLRSYGGFFLCVPEVCPIIGGSFIGIVLWPSLYLYLYNCTMLLFRAIFCYRKKNYMRGWYKVKVEKKLKELLLLWCNVGISKLCYEIVAVVAV